MFRNANLKKRVVDVILLLFRSVFLFAFSPSFQPGFRTYTWQTNGFTKNYYDIRKNVDKKTCYIFGFARFFKGL